MTGDRKTSTHACDWTTRCELVNTLEAAATTQSQEGAADSIGTGSIGAWASQGLVGRK
jgi:hypothetical protein